MLYWTKHNLAKWALLMHGIDADSLINTKQTKLSKKYIDENGELETLWEDFLDTNPDDTPDEDMPFDWGQVWTVDAAGAGLPVASAATDAIKIYKFLKYLKYGRGIMGALGGPGAIVSFVSGCVSCGLAASAIDLIVQYCQGLET